jgi:hypothetical protein
MSDQPAPRPFCDTWPFPVSDLDLVLPEDNDKAHKARGCCDGWLPAPSQKPDPGAVS